MKVMSSQRYIDWDIVEDKIAEMKENGTAVLIIPIINAYTQDLYGEDMFIMTDCHHRLQAARELGIEICFEEVEDELSGYAAIEAEDGETICAEWHMDSNWYYVETGEEVW